MTIIACNRTVMASDSESSSGDLRITLGPKIERVRSVERFSKPMLCGTAGYQQDGILFFDWLRKIDKKKPVLDESFQGLALSKEGIQLYEYKLAPFFVKEDFMAIGNGAEYAMGAMDHGATPEEAVELTCRRIEGCALPVFSLAL